MIVLKLISWVRLSDYFLYVISITLVKESASTTTVAKHLSIEENFYNSLDG